MAHLPMVEPRARNDPGRIGRFRVIGRLGAGGFGTVYVATRRDRADELVAVKVMQTRLAADHDFRTRFGREIRAIESVKSDYVPRLVDHDLDGETLWLATELVHGPSLQHVVERSGALPERTVWRLALGIAAALRDIHRECAHRDLKPRNVLLVPDGPRIIDFGLAHLTETDHQTASGVPMFSPDYAPPEQRERLMDAAEQADVFTFGGTLVFAATGHAPYSRRDPRTSPPDLSALPSSLYDVVAKCLCQDQKARPTVDDLIDHFKLLTTASTDGLAFASVLTDEIVHAIGAWRRELDEVTRLAVPASAAGLGEEPGGRPSPLAPGNGSTAVLTDAQALTGVFPGNRDRGMLTVPAPALASARSAEGYGATLEWRVRLGDWIRAPVAVTRDMAVAVTLGGVVAGFAAYRNGNVLGKVNLGVPVRSAVLPPGATSTGLAYVGGADGVVYAIDLAREHPTALCYTPAAIEGPLVAAGDYLYAMIADGRVYEIDSRGAVDPALVCHLRTPALGGLTTADGLLIAASADGRVHVIDPAAGKIRPPWPTRGLVFGAPAAVAGWLYIAGTDGRLRAARLDGTGQPELVEIGTAVYGAPVHDGGRLYLGGGDGIVRAYSISGDCAGKPWKLWESLNLGGEVSGIAAHGGTVVATAGRSLTVFDGASGQRRARFPAASMISAAPVMTDDFIYITSLDGAVTCLSLDNR